MAYLVQKPSALHLFFLYLVVVDVDVVEVGIIVEEVLFFLLLAGLREERRFLDFCDE